MNILQAVVQGFIQGFTEFLPVSSSGHLILGSTILGLPVPGLSFSIMLHVGTGFAVLVMLRNELIWILRALMKPDTPDQRQRASRICAYVVLASIPAGLVGILASDLVERSFSSGGVAALGLIVTGFVLKATSGRGERTQEEPGGDPTSDQGQEYPSYRSESSQQRRTRRRRGYRVSGADQRSAMPSVNLGRALVVGMAQAVAVVPGISRSGATIASGLLSGLSREDAPRFSFLLSIPAVFGAALLDIRAAAASGVQVLTGQALVGAATSFLAGLFALSVVFRVVRRGEIWGFAYYCWIAGLGSLLYLMFA